MPRRVRDVTQIRKRASRIAGLLLLAALTLCSGVSTADAAVTLSSFTATAGDGEVLLRWETETEIDNVGFFIQRSTQEAGEYARISPFIPAQGDGLIGSAYTYLDEDVHNGVT